MTPEQEKSEAQAKQFANTVFAVGAGVLIVGAFLLQSAAGRLLGEDLGENLVFIVATVLIVMLAAQRPQLALYALARQCRKLGHRPDPDGKRCSRCYQPLSGSDA